MHIPTAILLPCKFTVTWVKVPTFSRRGFSQFLIYLYLWFYHQESTLLWLSLWTVCTAHGVWSCVQCMVLWAVHSYKKIIWWPNFDVFIPKGVLKRYIYKKCSDQGLSFSKICYYNFFVFLIFVKKKWKKMVFLGQVKIYTSSSHHFNPTYSNWCPILKRMAETECPCR